MASKNGPSAREERKKKMARIVAMVTAVLPYIASSLLY